VTWKHVPLKAAGWALAALVALTGCGGGSSAAAVPAASSSANGTQLITCLQGHGISVSSTSDVTAVRTALRNVSQATRQAAIAACHQYLGSAGFAGAGKHKNKG
jgi:hypothetical protein